VLHPGQSRRGVALRCGIQEREGKPVKIFTARQ